MTPPSILWFRRDLRLGDHPALLAAAHDGPVLPVFVLDDALLAPSGRPRLAFLLRSLAALDRDVAYVPGASFFAGPPDRATLRLSFATETPERIGVGLERLADAWAGVGAQ